MALLRPELSSLTRGGRAFLATPGRSLPSHAWPQPLPRRRAPGFLDLHQAQTASRASPHHAEGDRAMLPERGWGPAAACWCRSLWAQNSPARLAASKVSR